MTQVYVAHADLRGGKWATTSAQYVILSYYHWVIAEDPMEQPRYTANIQSTASAWNATPTNIGLYEWEYEENGPTYNISIIEGHDFPGETWWGAAYTEPYPCVDCNYEYGSIALNVWAMDQLSDSLQTKIVAHELGHIFGLAHTSYSPSIMQSDPTIEFAYTTPRSYDISEINGLYP